MENRSKELIELRPKLGLDFNNQQTSEELNFQNKVLRPILKYQNDVFLKLFLNEILNKKIDIHALIEKDLRVKINNMLMKELQMKFKFIGVCIGMFANDELTFYFEHHKSINKRILSMLEERILDNILSS